MGHRMRFSLLLSTCAFLQGNEFPPQTVAGAFQARHKLDGCGSETDPGSNINSLCHWSTSAANLTF